ncbi:MAG: UDP-N-acetylmuramoyl-L-alanyl-D-glutamate--2,6-diaminopimelate ligase [Clostridia bacterium]|nr:UDP-N-acetylmuramoyl-L-alanyl-D-glutamate--2,6-diaminopimelate ligase [Clostridia bacterium]
MKLSALFDRIPVTTVSGSMEKEITGVCYDSRKTEPGFVFVCIVGYETDGHKYIASALEKGATAVVVQDGATYGDIPEEVTVISAENTRKTLAALGAAFFDHPEQKMKIIGITGTNGKTTVTTLIKSILEQEGKKVGLIGTNANMIGDLVLPTERTTPESFELYALFADMVQAGVEYVVMEVSSHSLELFRVYGIPYAVGAFTNLTQDHLDFHVTMENYLNAKKKLFLQSASGVVNIDDAAGDGVLKDSPCPMVSFSVDGKGDMNAKDVCITAGGVTFTLEYQGKTYPAELGIPGKFSVYNALTALGTVVSAGVPVERALLALKTAKGVMGRCETVPTGTDYSVIIDYAHTPDGLENILSTVREFTENRVITLFGCGGDRDRTKRPLMGEIAAQLSDYCVVTSDNPRTEEPGAIIEDIMVGVKKHNCPYTVIENRREAIDFALRFAEKGDTIVLAGKGHETYQIIGKTKNHFDEREVIAECLAAMK